MRDIIKNDMVLSQALSRRLKNVNMEELKLSKKLVELGKIYRMLLISEEEYLLNLFK